MNPTSYNVIHDESGLKPEHIQVSFVKFLHDIITLTTESDPFVSK